METNNKKLFKKRNIIAILIAIAALLSVVPMINCMAFAQTNLDQEETSVSDCSILNNSPHASNSVSIITQPVSLEATYYDNISFSVEVNNPSEVASYEWQVYFKGNWLTVNNPTYMKPSLYLGCIDQCDYRDPQYFRCKITDKSGNIIYSNEAECSYKVCQRKPHFYLVNNCVQVGETLDLAAKGIGKGTITYKDEYNIIFDNVEFSNDYYYIVKDKPAFDCGVPTCFTNQALEITETSMNYYFKGNNYIESVYDNYRGRGNGCVLLLLDMPVNLSGDQLEMRGGTMSVNANKKLSLTNFKKLVAGYSEKITHKWNDSINSQNDGIIIDNCNISIESEGTAIFGSNFIKINNSKININNTIQPVGSGITTKHSILTNEFEAKNTDLKIFQKFNEEAFIKIGDPAAPCRAIKANKCDIIGCQIYANCFAKNDFIIGLGGICLDFENIDNTIRSSSLIFDISSPSDGSSAISSSGNLIIDSSNIKANVDSKERADGIYCSKKVEILDSDINLNVDSKSKSLQDITGIRTDKLSISDKKQYCFENGNSSDNKHELSINANDGIAIMTRIGEGDTERNFEFQYQPTGALQLNDNYKVKNSDNAVINLKSRTGTVHDYVWYETFYDLSDITKPLSKVVIKNYDNPGPPEPNPPGTNVLPNNSQDSCSSTSSETSDNLIPYIVIIVMFFSLAGFGVWMSSKYRKFW